MSGRKILVLWESRQEEFAMGKLQDRIQYSDGLNEGRMGVGFCKLTTNKLKEESEPNIFSIAGEMLTASQQLVDYLPSSQTHTPKVESQQFNKRTYKLVQ